MADPVEPQGVDEARPWSEVASESLGREFYELMQTYRWADLADQKAVCGAFIAVVEFVGQRESSLLHEAGGPGSNPANPVVPQGVDEQLNALASDEIYVMPEWKLYGIVRSLRAQLSSQSSLLDEAREALERAKGITGRHVRATEEEHWETMSSGLVKELDSRLAETLAKLSAVLPVTRQSGHSSRTKRTLGGPTFRTMNPPTQEKKS